MKLFSSFGGGMKKPSVKPAISLAVFGKHPGWDDHIPGIGLETEELAHLKQSFYVTGIGTQIDSGAWEKLEMAKRIDGFNHTFLWLRAGHVLLGQLWSSVDRKGRAKYPLVLCTDSMGISTNWLLTNGLNELIKMHDRCCKATTAEPLIAECQASQARLRSLLESVPDADSVAAIPDESWHRFFASPLFGEQKVGLLRILHELASLQGSGKVSSRHLRVPVIGQSSTEAFRLWADFFRGASPRNMPLLFILRQDVEWLDVIVGEPAGDEFFCLQASPSALPLATQVPYELKPELDALLQKITATFLDSSLGPTDKNKHTDTTARPVVSNSPGSSGGYQRGGKMALVLFVLTIALIGGAGWFFFHSRQPELPVIANPEEVVAKPPLANLSESQQKFAFALAAGKAALTAKNYDEALRQAKLALDYKPGDGAATTVQTQAENAKRQLLADQQRQQEAAQNYNTALAAAKAALTAKNYDEALRQAQLALEIKPGDGAATEAQTQAENAKRQLLADQQRQQEVAQNYNAALSAAKAALIVKNYDEALRQAKLALENKQGDGAATALQTQAESLVKQQNQAFQNALEAGNAALAAKRYDEAIKQAQVGLTLKSGNLEALDLQKQAQAKLADQTAARQIQEQVNTILEAGQTAFDQKDYATAASKANAALILMPESDTAKALKLSAQNQANYAAALAAGNAALAASNYDEANNQARSALAINLAGLEALRLQADAAAGTDLQQVKALMNKPDAAAALALCNRHPNEAAFTVLATQIRQTELKNLDDKLETYQVWFGLIKPNNAKSEMARKPEQKKNAQDLANGQFTPPVIAYYMDLVLKLESQLNTLQQLDAGRALIIKKLKKSIEEHP